MATKGKISELYDIDNIKAQQAQVISYVEKFIAETEKAKPIKVKLEGSEKTKDIIKGITDLGAATKEYEKILAKTAAAEAKLKTLHDEQAKAVSELDKAKRKLSQSNSKEAKDVAFINAQSQENARNLKIEAQLQNAVAGSREFAKVKIKELTIQSDTLNVTTEAGKKKQAELNAKIDEYNKFLTDTADKQEKQRRNVGNYSGALKVLEKGLENVKKKLDDYGKSSNQNADVIEQLRKEEALLQSLLGNQVTGFATATQEVRANTKALQQLESAGLKGTAAYKDLFAATADLKDETSDLKKALTNAAPDDVAFNAAADAARGLVGVYGLAKSASAVFGEENKALQETMVKLQAAETALQSIEAVRALFKKENAVRQAINIGLQKIETLQTTLQTSAESKNIVVKYASIAAQKALNATMKLGTGPLGVILLLVGLLVASMSAFASGGLDVTKSLKKLNDELDINTKSLDKNLNAIKNASAERIAALKADFAEEKKIREEEQTTRNNELALLENNTAKSKAAYDKSLSVISKFNNQKKKLDAQRLADEEFFGATAGDVFRGIGSFFSSSNKITKEAYDDAIALRDKYEDKVKTTNDKASENRVQDLDKQKADAEDAAKLSQQSLQIRIDTAQTAAQYLQGISSDETKSYGERISALRKYTTNQKEQINLQRQQQLADPNLQPKERDVINNAADQKIIQAKRDGAKQITQLEKEEAERRRKANLDILTTELNDNIKASERIVDNDKKTSGERLDAAYEAFQLRAALIDAQLQEELKSETLTAEERKALAIKSASDINQLTIEYGAKQLEIIKANEEKITAEIEQARQNRIDTLSIGQNEEFINLNNAFKNGLISLTEYNQQRQKLEQEGNIQALEAERKNAFERYSVAKARFDLLKSLHGEDDERTKKANNDLLAAEKDLSDKRVALSDATSEKIKENEKSLRDLKMEFAKEAYDTFKTIVNAQFDKEKNAIQEQIDLNEDKKNKEIEAVNASTISQQEKADKIIVINARAQAQKEALERRQRQVDIERARFEKANNIAKIIAETAAAVVHQLATGDPLTAFGRAILVGAIGALQLAKAIATPIPKFKHGKGAYDDYEGWGEVGDGGKSELHVRGDGSVSRTPATPTLTWVGKNDIIHPDADKAMRDLQIASMVGMATNLHTPVAAESHGHAMSAQLISRVDNLASVIKNKRELHIKPGFNSVMAMHKYGSRWNRYINDQTNF